MINRLGSSHKPYPLLWISGFFLLVSIPFFVLGFRTSSITVSTLSPTLVAQAPAATAPSTNTARPRINAVEVTSSLSNYVRAEPSLNAEILGTVNQYDVMAYSEQFLDETSGLWYKVILGDTEGWISEINVVAIQAETISQNTLIQQTVAPPAPTSTPLPLQLLEQTPILFNVDADLSSIFQVGQQHGNNPRYFVKVGDSNTVAYIFLRPFDDNNYDLGSYSELQGTVNYFENSFGRVGFSADIGFNVASIFDPFFADDGCQVNETPLECEYRTHKPSFALVMFSGNDVIHTPPERYELYLRRLIDVSFERGVIPIFTTFPRRDDYAGWEKGIALNSVMVRLATEYDIPLINLWLAAQKLPNHGVGEDGVHLTQGGEGIYFDGSENTWGHTLRNLLTLQMLDALRENLGLSVMDTP